MQLRKARQELDYLQRKRDVALRRLRDATAEQERLTSERAQLLVALSITGVAALTCAGGFVWSRAALGRLSQSASAEMAKRSRLQNLDVTSAERSAAKKWANAVLPTLDALRAASSAHEAHASLVEGVRLTSTELEKALLGRGVAEIPALIGAAFDPNVHEAVTAVDAAAVNAAAAADAAATKKGDIVDVMQTGWLLDDSVVLRPARVVVAK
jgi:molecular chaperone GrpE (heat shock protein)